MLTQRFVDLINIQYSDCILKLFLLEQKYFQTCATSDYNGCKRLCSKITAGFKINKDISLLDINIKIIFFSFTAIQSRCIAILVDYNLITISTCPYAAWLLMAFRNLPRSMADGYTLISFIIIEEITRTTGKLHCSNNYALKNVKTIRIVTPPRNR